MTRQSRTRQSKRRAKQSKRRTKQRSRHRHRGGAGEKSPYPPLFQSESKLDTRAPGTSGTDRQRTPYPAFNLTEAVFRPFSSSRGTVFPDLGSSAPSSGHERQRSEYPPPYQPESTYLSATPPSRKRTSPYPAMYEPKAKHAARKRVTFPYYPQLAYYEVQPGAKLAKTGRLFDGDPVELAEAQEEMRVAQEEWAKDPLWYGGRRRYGGTTDLSTHDGLIEARSP